MNEDGMTLTGEQLLKLILVLMLQEKTKETTSALFAEGAFWRLNISIEEIVEE